MSELATTVLTLAHTTPDTLTHRAFSSTLLVYDWEYDLRGLIMVSNLVNENGHCPNYGIIDTKISLPVAVISEGMMCVEEDRL